MLDVVLLTKGSFSAVLIEFFLLNLLRGQRLPRALYSIRFPNREFLSPQST